MSFVQESWKILFLVGLFSSCFEVVSAWANAWTAQRCHRVQQLEACYVNILHGLQVLMDMLLEANQPATSELYIYIYIYLYIYIFTQRNRSLAIGSGLVKEKQSFSAGQVEWQLGWGHFGSRCCHYVVFMVVVAAPRVQRCFRPCRPRWPWRRFRT